MFNHLLLLVEYYYVQKRGAKGVSPLLAHPLMSISSGIPRGFLVIISPHSEFRATMLSSAFQ